MIAGEVEKISSESSWIYAMEENELQENGMRAVFPKGISVLLIRKNGQIYALSNKCAHMVCALAGGILEGYAIKCPCHDWRFDIRTGEFLDAKEIRIPVYDFRVSDDKIFVKIAEEE